MFFADFSDTNRIIALVIAAVAIALLLFSKAIARKILEKKYSDTESEEYKSKFLSVTLIFKGIAAGVAVIACVISLIN